MNYCIITTLFRCQVLYLAKCLVNGNTVPFQHSTVNEDLSHDRKTHKDRYFLSEKTRKSNHLQMLEHRQHLLNYFKNLSVGTAGNRTRASCTIDWQLTNKANQTRREEDIDSLPVKCCHPTELRSTRFFSIVLF